MKIRSKITFITMFITVLFVFFSNIAFEKFFSNYLEDQEQDQIEYISKSINSFFDERKNQYRGSVNDWSHWDDTYNFTNNNYPEFKEKALIKDDFINLELNFAIVVDEDNIIKSKQFYNLNNKKFAQFPEGFNKDIDEVIKYSVSNEDTSSIAKIGDEFYFIATSQITDTNKEKDPNGKLIFGRLIDENMIKDLEKVTDSQISFSTINNLYEYISKEDSLKESGNILFNKVKFSKNKDTIVVELIYPNTFHEDDFTLVKLEKTRDLFIAGMNQIEKFMYIYAHIMVLILFVVFTLLGRYISKPFTKLISEVKNLDLTKSETQKLKIYGKDEFSFLRNSINNMLSKIETEQFKVRENKEKLYAILTSVGDGVIAVDKNGKIEFINDIAQKLTGWRKEEAYGQPVENVFKIIGEHNNTILISKDGLERDIENTSAPIKDKFGNVIGVVLVFKDISERKEKLKQIEFLSYHDQLTGLHNRRYFEEALEKLDTKANMPLSIVFADANGLKTINDAFGHEYGDLLIQQISDVLKTEFRTEDIISRTGGDEFVILLPKTEGSVVQNLIKNIKEKIEKKTIMNINISASFGWDTKHNESQSIWSILKNAEDFMYQKKILDGSNKRSTVIKSIINTLYLNNPREDAHSKRVGILCEDIGKAYNLSDDKLKELKVAGELHDIGKIAVDDTILNKPSKLSNTEWTQIKRHPETGYRLLCTSSEYYNIVEYILAHHERWDGSGYPKGLKGYQIPWKARIISIADSYDAMTCDRSYRKPLSKEEAIEEIKKNAGTQFDPEIAKVFVEILENDSKQTIYNI